MTSVSRALKERNGCSLLSCWVDASSFNYIGRNMFCGIEDITVISFSLLKAEF